MGHPALGVPHWFKVTTALPALSLGPSTAEEAQALLSLLKLKLGPPSR